MRTLSRRGLFGAACLACGGAHLGLSATPVQAQPQPQPQAGGWRPPPAGQRCPSRWGADDARGAMNLLTPERVQRAARLIRAGTIIEIGRVLEPAMPFFGTRRFDVHLKRSGTPAGANRLSGNEEVVIGEIGHVGTQLDGFPHITIDGQAYNCVGVDGIAQRGGFTRMGIDTVGTILTRGVLLDVAGLKGQQTLAMDYEITVADLEEALRRQNTALEPGDAVLINTGWGHLWARDNARYVSGCPGIGVAAAEWLTARQPILLGSDNWPVEVIPNPDRELAFPVHQIALVVHGVHLLEDMRLDELAERRAYEFAFLMQPLKIKGGTGSTVAPSALL